MIRRINELKIEGFRAFLKRQVLPFSADAVLLYGPNGTGKSGILAALEFALTGGVRYLARYGDDYPRCLTHIRSHSPGTAAVSFESQDGTPGVLENTVGSTQCVSLPPAEARVYSERCFLSQARLQRLIESYLSEDEYPEQPLVRFGRELLGLDVLEDLTNGLYEVADLRRVRTASPSYQQLLTLKETLDEKVTDVARLIEARRSSFESMLESARGFSPYPIERTEDLLTLSDQIEAVQGKRSVDRATELAHCRALDATLETALALLRASGLGHAQRVESPETELGRLDQRRKEIEWRLQPVLTGLSEDLLSEDAWIADDNSADAEVATRIERVEGVLKRRLGVFEAELKSLRDFESERSRIESRLAEVTAAISVLAEVTPADIQGRREWVNVLRSVASRIHTNQCPICERNYSEVNSGSLRDKVLREADEINRQLHATERDASSRTALQSEQRELATRLDIFTAEIEQRAKHRHELELNHSRYTRRLRAIAANAALRNELNSINVEIRRCQRRIADNHVRISQQTEAMTAIRSVASGLDAMESVGTLPVSELTRRLKEALSTKVQDLIREEERFTRLMETARLARTLDSELRDLKVQLDEAKQRQRAVHRGCRQIEEIVQRARKLRVAAIETKSKLLNEAFTASLNRVWREFFERLARVERFRPEMSEPHVVRNVIRTNVRGVASDAAPFMHIGSVLSSGNLNTAALSLFLALHTLDRSSHSVLVLDDPVQSVDDVHVVQLAIVLRALITQTNRQVIVAVHDRDLFEYLSLELAPVEEGRRLITIELERAGSESDVAVQYKTKTWEPSIRFGT